MTHPIAPVLDHYLAAPMELVKEVHAQLPAILKVAEHLTPVEDLLDFKQQVEAIHDKLMLLVAASELILKATPPGIDLLTAATIEAQREFLKLKSAALREEEYFATAAQMSSALARIQSLESALATMQVQINEILEDLLTKVDREEFEGKIQELLARIQEIEDWIGPSLGSTNQRITDLIDRLTNGEFTEALARAIQELTVRVERTEAGLLSEAQFRTELETEVTDLKNQVSGNSSAYQNLLSRVESGEGYIDSLAQDTTRLQTQVADLVTGQTANSGAIQELQTRSTINEGTISTHGQFLTQLDNRIVDTNRNVDMQGQAISNLETRMSSSEAGQSILLSEQSQLNARLLDTENNLNLTGQSLSELTTRIDRQGDDITIVNEDITRLTAGITSVGNLLVNAGLEADTYGWGFVDKGQGWLATDLKRNLDEAQPAETNALSVTATGVPSGVLGVRSVRIPLEEGKRYLLSGQMAAENCRVRLEWRTLGPDGNELDFGFVGETTQGPSPRLGDWERFHGELLAPVDGTTFELQWWIDQCHTDSPKAWLLRPMVEEAAPGQLLPSPWVPGNAGVDAKYAQATSQLIARLDQTDDSVSALAQEVTDLRVEIGDMDSTAIQELTARVTDIEGVLDSTATSITSLESNLSDLEGLVSGQATAISDLSTQVTNLGGDYSSLSSSVTELSNTLHDSTSGLATKASASALSSLESQVAEQGEDLLSASSAITNLQNTLNHPSTGLASKASSSVVAQLDSRVSAVEASASDVTELEARLGTVEGSLIQEMITSAANDASHTSAINMMESRLDDPDTGLVATANGLSGLRTRVTTVEGKTESHATHLTNLQAQVNALDLDAGGSGQAIADLTTRVEEVEDGIESHGQAITALQNSVTSANKVYVQDAQPSTTGQSHGNLWIDSNDNNKLYAFNSATNKWELRQDSGKNTIFVQGTQPTARAVNDLWFDTSRNNRQFRWNGSAWVEVTDTRTAANASAITSLTNRVSSVEGTNTTQSQQITTLTNRINDSSTGLAASASAISDLKTRMTSAEGVNTSQGSAITSLENKVNHSTSGNSALASALSGLRTRVTATEGSISTQSSQISSLESKINHGTTGLSATYNSVTSLSSTVNTLSGKVNTEASKLSSLTTTVNGHTSSITSHSGSINGMKSWHRVTLNSNGHISGTRSENDGTKSSFSVLATVFRVITSGSTGLEWQNGYLRAYSGSVQLVLGINFGRDNNLCFWYGPNVGANGCTKANGTIWFDNVGGAYFGGSLHAGVLRNAATSTQVSSRASVETGVFGTNGNQKIVTYSLSYSNGFTTSSNLGGTATITATIVLERSYNGGSWSQVSSRTISGTRYFHGYEPGVGYTYNFQLSGSSSYTDNRTGTGTFNYRTRVTANSGWPFIAPSGFQGYQQLTVTSIEE